jgi:hypothetical protein
VAIWTYVGGKASRDKGEWNDHGHRGKGEVLGEWRRLFDVLDKMAWRSWGTGGIFGALNGMELGYDTPNDLF